MSPRRPTFVRRAARGRAGFTLIELMVAIGLSGVIAVGLYSLSMVASQTFQQQQRVSEMQLRLRLAMESLRSDVARAGYMATPNSVVDPRVCPRPTLPLQAVRIDAETTNPTHNATNNRFVTPVRLQLTGNYLNTDEYAVMAITGSTVYLQNRSVAYNRIPDATTFSRMFTGRMVRLVGTNGVMQFGTVADVTYQLPSASTYPSIRLSSAPTVIGGAISGSTASAGCGIPGLGVGATIAPVTMVEYRIASVAATQANAYLGGANSPLRFGKTDLVRTELTPGATRTEVDQSERIVAEYAVDFDVAAVVVSGTATNGDPTLARLGWGDTQNTTIVGDASTGNPQRVRSLLVRLSVRDRVQDPDFGWTQRAAATDPLTRFQVFTGQRGAARVRSLVTEIALPNVSARNIN